MGKTNLPRLDRPEMPMGADQETLWSQILGLGPGGELTAWVPFDVDEDRARRKAFGLRSWVHQRRRRHVAMMRAGQRPEDLDLSGDAARRLDPLAGVSTMVVERSCPGGVQFGLVISVPRPGSLTIIKKENGTGPGVQVWPPVDPTGEDSI